MRTSPDDIVLLRDAAAEFLGAESPVAAFRALRDADPDEGWSPELWAAMAELGWAGLMVPEALGGSEMGAVAAGVVARAHGLNLATTPFLSTAVLGVAALQGRDEELRAVAAGAATVALAVDDGPRHDPDHQQATATAEGRVTGTKVHVVDGHTADLLVVAAQAPDGPALFLVRASEAEISATAQLDVRRSATVRVDTVAERLGPVTPVLDLGRAVLAAELVGAGHAVFQRTVDYLRERKQFGVAIGTFQALQHRAARVYVELELAGAATRAALRRLEADPAGAAEVVSVAKAKASDAAVLAANEAIQLHGGIGMTDEHDCGLFVKRIRALATWLGDGTYHADRLARLRGY